MSLEKFFIKAGPIIFFIAGILFFSRCGSDEQLSPEENLPPLVNYDEYGLQTDSLDKFESVVKKNQTLADLLLPFKVNYNIIAEIALKSREVFDVKKIRAGNRYVIYTSRDSIPSTEYLIYELDPVNFIVYNLNDSINVFTGKKIISIREKSIKGTINQSLYTTLQELGADDELAIRFSEVFAWQIDFYRIQNGDNFKALYEELYIGDEFVGIGKIIAALFNHMNEDFYAFSFDQDGALDYFDEEGNSLQKVFLKAPLKFSRISSGYSRSRLHPILRTYRPHLGIDYAAAVGTPVAAVGDGIVTYANYRQNEGRYVKIRHNGTYTSGYMHLSRYGKGIKVGAAVKQGQIVGYVGSSGLSTGPHLDFRFWKNGQLVNYLNVKFPPSHPVKQELKEIYNLRKDSLLTILNIIDIPTTNLPVLSSETAVKNQ